MSRTLQVWPLPTDFEPEAVRGGIVVVLDVLRASSTMVTAIANGAESVIPCADVAAAQQIALECRPNSAALGGERGGVRIPGFDLDNSPASFSADRVAGKTIVFTTTNGTAALLRSKLADRILIGSLLNRRATVTALRGDHRPIHLVCAGTDGVITAEDLLGAGAIAFELLQEPGDSVTQDDVPLIAQALWASCARSAEARLEILRRSRGGRNLVSLGLEKDLELCAAVDTIDAVVEYFPAEGRVLPVR